jgi:hypothetical protein
MGLSVSDAYNQIKNLENTGQLTLPQPQETVTIGTIDPLKGTFTYVVPTVQQTTVIPPVPPSRTNTIINITLGVVATKAVDVRLKFNVVARPLVNGGRVAVTTSLDVNGNRTNGGGLTAVSDAARNAVLHNGDLNGLFGPPSGVTITGFPTVTSASNEIIVDAGMACSAAIQNAPNITPAVTRFPLTINIPNQPAININLMILRPPVLGMGAFLIPALPMTIVYAPPQGKLKKNTMTYSDTVTLTRTVSSSISNSTETKTAQAFSAADLIGKVAGAIAAVAAVVGTGGADAGADAGLAGALGSVVTSLVGTNGGAKDANDSTADVTQLITNELQLVSGILNAVADPNTSNDGTISNASDNSLTLSVSNMSLFGSAAGLGPGVGDRIVYMKNVRVVWVAVNGQVGINVLGFDAIGANAVNDLQQELASLQNGGSPRLGLDLATIQELLNYDPLTAKRSRILTALGAPLVGAPRFVPANPPERTGSGTTTDGDQFQVSFDTATELKQTTSHVQTSITDAKPGWVSVLFGDPNVETTTTTTFTTSQSIDTRSEDKLTSTLTMNSEGVDDPYDIRIFYDCTFGTYLALDANSPALKGSEVLVNLEPVLANA